MSKIHNGREKSTTTAKFAVFFLLFVRVRRTETLVKFLSKLPLRVNFAEFFKERNEVYL